jgi:fatty acid desaturase
MGIVTGMVASNWLIQHKYGHHRLGQAPEGFVNKWDFAKPGELDEFSVPKSIWYSIRTSFPIFFFPLVESFKKGILQNVKSPINYRYAFIEQSALIGFVVVVAILNPIVTFGYLMPWYCLVYFITRYTDYLNHYGRSDRKFDSSNNSLHKSYNAGQRNFGYHSAHHHRPSAHWSELPHIHEQIIDKLRPDQLKPYSWSGFQIPYHFYLSVRGKI